MATLIILDSEENIDPNVQFIKKQKFQPKLCVWLAISAKGRSAPYFVPAKNAIKAEMYAKECIKKMLKPFLNTHHPDGKYIFWPDLASCHYAKHTQDVLHELEINFVDKSCNPPNVPQIRPIERFWALLKRRVYKDGWEAENLSALKARIKYCLRQFKSDTFANLMSGVGHKVTEAAKNGPEVYWR